MQNQFCFVIEHCNRYGNSIRNENAWFAKALIRKCLTFYGGLVSKCRVT